MSLTLLIQLLVVGLATGAIYALIALGYTMVYGIIELINFAHGDIFMIGTLICISIFGAFGITNSSTAPTGFSMVGILLLTLVGSMVLCAVLGVVIERVAYRPLRNAPRLAPLISAIGVSLILEDIGKLWKGITIVSFPQIFPNVTYYLGPVSFSSVDILVIVVALVLMVALQWMVSSTRIGRAMRAVAQDREAAALMGVNVNRIIAVTFFIGAALAGAAALIWGLKYGSTQFTLGFQLGLFAFTAAVLGGIGNLVGAMLGGVLIGVIEALATLIPDSSNGGFGLPHGGAAWHVALIFLIVIFYATVIALAGYLVAADSGLRGMYELWIDIAVFVLVPLFLVQSMGLIIGLALCAVIWPLYFFARRRLYRALNYTPPTPLLNLKVLDAEQSLRRAVQENSQQQVRRVCVQPPRQGVSDPTG